MLPTTISVIIPAYNVSQYIVAALESLNAQESLPDEVIIIDDGSSDDTLNIIRHFEHAYPVKILATPNRGQGEARNLGLSLAKGEYVYFFDSDDLLKPDFFSEIRSIIVKQEKPDIVFFSGECLYETEWLDEEALGYGRGFGGYYESAVELLDAFRARGVISPMPCLYISKLALWKGNGLEFIKYYHEDEHVLYPLIFSASTYYVTDAAYFIRRVRSSSTMTQLKSARHVLGLKETTASLLSLRSCVDDRRAVKHVDERALHFVKRYVILCRKVGLCCDKRLLVSLFMKLGNPRVLAYYFYYSSGPRLRRVVKRILDDGVNA